MILALLIVSSVASAAAIVLLMSTRRQLKQSEKRLEKAKAAHVRLENLLRK